MPHGQVSKVMLDNAKAAGVGSTDDGLLKVLYIAHQSEIIQGMTHSGLDKHSGLLAPSTTAGEIEGLVDVMGGGLMERVKWLFPWHEMPQDLDLATAVALDGEGAENLLMSIDSLLAYANGKGQTGKYDTLDGFFKESMRAVIDTLKRNVDASLPTVNADGTVEVRDVDRMGMALRAAARLKKEHACLYGLGGSGDFLQSALKSVGVCHDKLGAALGLSAHDTVQTEALLQVVRSLCSLDDALEDDAHKFGLLYRQHEALLREKMDGNVKGVLELIEQAKFAEVEMMMQQHGLKASVPWQIKAELSNKIEAQLEGLLRKLRLLTCQLPVADIDDIVSTYRALKKATSLVDASTVRDDVCKDFQRVILETDPGQVKKQLLLKMQGAEAEVEQLLSSEQLGKAACLVHHIQQASISLQDLLVDQTAALEVDVSNKLKVAVEKSLLKMQQLPVEKWQYQPPAALFQLFDSGSLEATVLQPYAAGLEAVWDALEQKAHDTLASSYLGAGSEEAEMLGRALKALPEGPRREALCGKLEEGQKAALGQLNQLSRAMGEWDAVAIIDMARLGKPSARKQLLETIEVELLKLKRKFRNALEKNPEKIEFNDEFISEWTFVVELKDVAVGDDSSFIKKLDQIKEGVKEGLATAEHEAASALSNFLDNRNLDASQRFRNVETALDFLKKIVQFKAEFGTRELGQAIQPLDFGARTRDVLRHLVLDFKKQKTRLSALLLTQSPDKAVDVHKIAGCLKGLRECAHIYTQAKFTLEHLDSVMLADSWTMTSKADLGSVILPSLGAASRAELEWDPEMWDDIDERMGRWVVDTFKLQPDLQTKIKISSDRVVFFQLIGRKVAADTPHLLSLLAPFVSNAEAKQLLSDEHGFQAKVVTAARHLWDALKAKCRALNNTPADASIFKGADYSNKSHAAFQQAKMDMADINKLYDAVKLFKQHVAPFLDDTTATEQMDVQSLSDSLLERVNAMAVQLEQLDLAELDAIAGLLMTMHSQSEELLFQANIYIYIYAYIYI